MLRVNVGLSRKLSKDYNSTGFSINLDGEITAPVSDPEAVIEQAKELFDLAEEALALQIERHESEIALASHDSPGQGHTANEQNGNGRNGSSGNGNADANAPGRNGNGYRPSTPNGNGNSNGNGNHQEPATNKQIQFLLRLGEQQRMTKMQLESRVSEILGRPTDIYQLSKRDAGFVLNNLTAGSGQRA